MSKAVIRWIGGPVLHAHVTEGEFRLGEAVEVGGQCRPGEVIRLRREEIVGQVYEDTTGLRPGDAVHGWGGALSVKLGPGLLGRIFDGLLRPLDQNADANDKVEFCPLVKVGDRVVPERRSANFPVW
jgi:V/A-type H+-transporting ATPase subunit A